jgi:prepilin-type N-terminal cleavage/methylation domain-containing protein
MRQRRQGFTLVEMLVAMTLTLFIMAILSEAFVNALDTFRSLKAIGDMEENLRVATTNLRNDLRQYHFEGTRRLSDPNANLLGSYREGFFVVFQGAQSTLEGVDTDGLPSYIAPPIGVPAASHVLHFSIRLRGNRPENVFAASVPGGSPLLALPTNYYGQTLDELYMTGSTYNSQWAEVAYFLVPIGTTIQPNNQAAALSAPPLGVPLYALYRSQFVAVPNNTQVNGGAVPTTQLASGLYLNLACNPDPSNPNNLYFYSPNDLAGRPNVQARRTFNPASILTGPLNMMNRPPLPSAPLLPQVPASVGATLVMTNVISFNVRVIPVGGADQDVNPSPPAAIGPAVYDTAGGLSPFAGTGIPIFNYPLSAVQISIRTWDIRTQQTRQITIVQDM